MKKIFTLLLIFTMLFTFISPAFALTPVKKDTYYILVYTKPSYKFTPYEKLFRDHREFLNTENYKIEEITDISIAAAYRDDNPHIHPPYYVLCIEIKAKNGADASRTAVRIFNTGIPAKVRVLADTGEYSKFRENFIPEVTIPEAHFALYTPGDIVCCNEVSAYSARTVLRISVGLENKEDYPWLLGDMNGDGILTASDARTILRISVGLETTGTTNV